MTIILNGKERSVPETVRTVADLVEHLGLKDRPIAVEVNRELVPRASHPHHGLSSGDRVEILQFVGGG
ncbi:MAG: sulfur carrier protein ThiS [Candidatus Hydrogenedentota bacterium]|nr:MAG: sulfur carrier protein ThiS [Candidatus Hydrogenedentota bacterium]